MCEKMSNKWDIMLSLFTNNKDTNLKREYLVYEHELVTIKQLYSVNVIRYVKIEVATRCVTCHNKLPGVREPRNPLVLSLLIMHSFQATAGPMARLVATAGAERPLVSNEPGS